MNLQHVPLERCHSVVCGFSFGSAKPKVLCRTPSKVLLLVPGYSGYGGRCSIGSVYSATALWRFMRNEDGFGGAKKIAEGGRFTVARLLELGTAIDEAMGEEGLAQLLDPAQTLVLGQCDQFGGEGYWGPRKLGWGHKSEGERLADQLEASRKEAKP